MHLPSAKNQVLRHQHYHLQCINVCVKMKLVILLGEKPNLPNPIPYEDSIASVRAYWKTALVPGGLLAALKQQQQKKKKIKRCWNFTQMLLLHGKAVISRTERHCTDSGQKGWTHANHRLNEIASLPHCSSIGSGGWGKELEICSLLETVKNLLGEEKKREGRRTSFPFLLLPLLKPKWV